MRCERARKGLSACVVGAIAAMGLAFGLVQPAAAEPLVETEGEPMVLTLPAQETATFFVALAPVDGVELDAATIEVASVTHEGMPFGADGRADGAITTSIPSDDDRIEIEVEVDHLSHHGTYAVGLRLAIPGGAEGEERTQQLSLTLTRPPAVLSVPEVVEVERTRRIGRDPNDSDPNVLIRPDDSTRLSELTVTVTDPDPEGVRVDGEGGVNKSLVGHGAETAAIEPGDALSLELVLTEDLPLGSIDRTVELTSPQLADPKTITYRISTRHHPMWIVVLIAVGLLLGLIVRRLPTWLARRVSLYRSWARLKRQLSGLVVRYPGAPDLEQLRALSDRLGKNPGFQNPNADIEETLQDGTERAKEWVTKLNAELTPLAARLGAAAAPVRSDWMLLDEAQERLEAVREYDAQARKQLETGDVQGLTSTVETLERSVVDLRTVIAHAARNETADRMDDLAQVLTGQTAPRRLNTVLAQIESLRAEGRKDIEQESTVDALSRLHRMRWAVKNLTEELRVVAAQMPIELTIHPDRKAEFEAALDQVGLALKAGNPEARLVDLARRLEVVYELHDPVHKADDAREGEGVDTDERSGVDAAGVAPTPQLVAAEAFSPAGEVTEFVRATNRLTAAMFVLGGIRFVVLGGLLVLTAYRWFEPTWTGTLSDISTVLLWAFGADVTTELVLRARTQNPTNDAEPDDPAGPEQPADPAGPGLEPTAPVAVPNGGNGSDGGGDQPVEPVRSGDVDASLGGEPQPTSPAKDPISKG